jgi:hypothetical protein
LKTAGAQAVGHSSFVADFYKVRINNLPKIVRIATIAAVIYLLLFGIAMAFFPIRPFWNDEWRLIYNIKFKDLAGLWGRLDLLQECPRVYLSLIKLFSQAFDYSYTSLRLPPLVIGTISVVFLFWLRRRLFDSAEILSYLFILIFVSSQTFTDYLTQVKQYEMDLLLCLLALWQLWVLLSISSDEKVRARTYGLLCLSLLLVPYLSYVYPIAIAPVFLVAAIAYYAGGGKSTDSRRRHLARLLMPLALVSVSILVFYLADVRHVMADKSMYDSYLKVYYQGGQPTVIGNFWNLFALVGSGFLFELIFGILGIAGFGYGIYRLAGKRLEEWNTIDHVRLYAVLLLVLVFGLLVTGKIVGGVARLTAYTVPSISILIISLLQDLRDRFGYPKISGAISAVLILGLLGNIISSCINTFTYTEYESRIATYRHTAKALREARLKKVPFLYTDGVCGDRWEIPAPVPGKISRYNITPKQIAGADTVAAEVIVKVNPEYKVWDSIPLYYMPDAKWMVEYMKQLPDSFRQAMVGDGLRYRIIKR